MAHARRRPPPQVPDRQRRENATPARPLQVEHLLNPQRAAGSHSVQRFLQPSPLAGMIGDPNTPTGGALDERVQRQVATTDSQRHGRRPSALSRDAVIDLQRAAGNQAVQRLLQPAIVEPEPQKTVAASGGISGAPWARAIGDPNQPAGGRVSSPYSVLGQQDGPMRSAAPVPTVPSVQRKIGDGHDLKSARLKVDPVLEAVFDNERVLTSGSSGPSVLTLQHALTDLGIRTTKHGVDGMYGAETKGQVKTFQKDAGLVDDGVVGPKTMEALDNQLLTGAGGAGPLPSPVPAAPGKAAPTLAATISVGPTAGINGEMNFVVNWNLGGNAGPKGGFIIQDVLFVWRTRMPKARTCPTPTRGPARCATSRPGR